MCALSTLCISGKCFGEGTELKLFGSDSHRFSLVFGRNGAGKTTLSEAIRRQIVKDDPDPNVTVTFKDASGAPYQKLRNTTYVYNEAFVEEQVHIQNNGLSAIVLLGEAGDYSEKIKELAKQKDVLEKSVDGIKRGLDSYSAEKGSKSVAAAKKAALACLKGAGSWASRHAAISGAARNAAVNEQRLEQIASLPLPKESLGVLHSLFDKKLDEYLKIKTRESAEYPAVPDIDAERCLQEYQHVQELLALQIERPTLTDRDKRIIQIADRYGAAFVSEALEHHQNDELGFCPYCYRDISSDQVSELGKRVSQVLNDDVREHQNKLESARIAPDLIDLTPYKESFRAFVDRVFEEQQRLEQEVEALNVAISKKQQNVFDPVSTAGCSYEEALARYQSCVEELASKVDAFNASIRAIGATQRELYELNDLIARKEIDEKHSSWRRLQQDKAAAENCYQERLTALLSVEEELESYRSKMANTRIACDLINQGLAYIFMDANRLRLEGSHGEYQLFSRGKPVTPSDVSVGERNAIALCYFFAGVGAGKAEADRFSEESFVLIDDPISSFDFENKIGMLTYIRQQLGKVLSGNRASKALVLTHDAQTMQNLEKLAKDLKQRFDNPNSPAARITHKAFELDNGTITEWKGGLYKYSDQLKHVYEYAKDDPSSSLRPVIGNITRRVLEAFSTFEYQKGIDCYTSEPKILAQLAPVLRSHFEGYMGRLILHDESHAKDAIDAIGSIHTGEHYSDRELKQMTRNALCLLYSLNSEHVLSHLDDATAESTIKQWIEEIEALYATGDYPAA